MKKQRMYWLAGLVSIFVLIVVPVHALEIFLTSTDAGGAFRTLNGNDLSQEIHATGSLPGVTALAIGEVDATSDGEEIIVGREGTLEIRARDGYTLLNSRGGFNQINSIAVGEVFDASPGNEIVIGITTSGGAGECHVISSQDLSTVRGTGAGLAVTAVAIGDVDLSSPGNEVIFCWEYQVGFVQVSIRYANPNPALGLESLKYWNYEGVCRDAIAIGDFDSSQTGPEMALGFDNGALRFLNGNMPWPATLTIPNGERGGFGNVTAVAVGEFDTAVAGLEVAVGSTDSGGALRVIEGNNIGNDLRTRAGFSQIYHLAVGDVHTSDGNELIVASEDGGGSLRVMDNDASLTDLDSRGPFGVITSLGLIDSPLNVKEWFFY